MHPRRLGSRSLRGILRFMANLGHAKGSARLCHVEVSMLTISNCNAARLALLIMYAWDMCDLDRSPTSKAVDPRIALDGYDVVGFITGG